jgi:hypothetical protein
LVGGYTGPGGKTILPHRAAAKLDLRLVPDMRKDAAAAALKKHLVAHGFGDIEVNVTGGYDPTGTPASSRLIQAQLRVLKRGGIEPVLWPRNAGSYPGYVFTGPPLKLASGQLRTYKYSTNDITAPSHSATAPDTLATPPTPSASSSTAT